MTLESLANESLFDIFEYLPTSHLLNAFYSLNTHFDQLLFAYFRVCRHLDLHSISKQKFGIVCQQIIPTISDQLLSLHLSDDDETPQQIELFLLQFLPLHQFRQLRSFSCDSICSEQTLDKILSQLPHFRHLTHLNMNMLLFELNKTILGHIFNTVWSLAQLIYCHLISIQWSVDSDFNFPTMTSSTLKCLTLAGGPMHSSQVTHLLTYTPRLENLSVRITQQSSNGTLFQPVASITVLEIHWWSSSENELRKFLESMPNLYQLKIETQYMNLNGHQWKEIIVNYLPKLNKFHLTMQVKLRSATSVQTYIENQLDSFRTSFWLYERQWFVRCDWDSQNSSKLVHLYTWPYAFESFYYDNRTESKWTSLGDTNTWSYRCVHSLSYSSSFSKYPSLSPARFSHLHHLTFFLSWDDHFVSIVPRLDRLISLRISRYDDRVQSRIQTLLDRIPYIYSLAIDVWSGSNIAPIEVTSKSIRRLEFKDYFDHTRCTALSRSPLGIQCEVLVIDVVNRTNLLQLVSTIPNLRALTCQYTAHIWNQNAHCLSSTKESPVEWLQQHLPSTCSVTQDTYTRRIRLWIR